MGCDHWEMCRDFDRTSGWSSGRGIRPHRATYRERIGRWNSEGESRKKLLVCFYFNQQNDSNINRQSTQNPRSYFKINASDTTWHNNKWILPQIYNTFTQELVAVAEGHEGEISKLAFNPQGTKLLTASADKTARIWDITNGQCVQVSHNPTQQLFG